MSIEDRVNLMMLEKENKLVLREILRRATNNDRLKKELEECTFSPKKFGQSKMNCSRITEPFEQRLKDWEERKQMKINKRRMEKEVENRMECTFQPKISKVKNTIMRNYPSELTQSYFLQSGLANHYDRMNRARVYHNQKKEAKSRSRSVKKPGPQRQLRKYSRSPVQLGRMSRSRARRRSRVKADRSKSRGNAKDFEFERVKDDLRKCLLDL